MTQNYSLEYYPFNLEDCLAWQLSLHLSKKILISPYLCRLVSSLPGQEFLVDQYLLFSFNTLDMFFHCQIVSKIFKDKS